jgi:hypothetical protein
VLLAEKSSGGLRRNSRRDVAPLALGQGSLSSVRACPPRVRLSANIPGYRSSLLNPSLDRLSGFSIIGRVSGNLEGLLVLQEPGQFKHDWNQPYDPDDQPRDKPLRGLAPDRVPRP